MAESIRAVFAAFVWHEGIVHDTMAVASYLKFHPGLSKQGQNHGSAEAGGAAGSDQDGAGGPTQQSKETKARQRHSVEVRHSELNRISISRKKHLFIYTFHEKNVFSGISISGKKNSCHYFFYLFLTCCVACLLCKYRLQY